MAETTELKPSVIFIPDISGFTTFINEAEIDHSTKLITELIETIIESDILGLKVSEIEGDAVLFYRHGEEPTFEELVEQTEHMFLEFHKKLKLHERDRMCPCQACTTAKDLTLKFVYHYGKTTLVNIKSHEKLLGPDVTLAHRLLKNEIPSDEYLLMSAMPTTSNSKNARQWIQLQNGSDSYQGIGAIDYTHFSLTPLNLNVKDPEPRPKMLKYDRPIQVSATVSAPLDTVYTTLIDNSLKPKWIKGLRSVIDKGNGIISSGQKYVYQLKSSDIVFEVGGQEIKEGEIEYRDKTENFKLFSPLNAFYKLTSASNDQTEVAVEVHYKPNLLSKLYLDWPFRWMVKNFLTTSLSQLSNVSQERMN